MQADQKILDTLYFVAQRGWHEGTSAFLLSLVQHLADVLGVAYAFVDEIDSLESRRARTVAFHAHGKAANNFEYDLAGTPCENVFGRSLCIYPHSVQSQFPRDSLLADLGIQSYAGMPLWNSHGKPIGLIAVMDTKPLADEVVVSTLLQIVAIRVAAELESKQADYRLHESERGYRATFDAAPSGLANVLPDGRILRSNRRFAEFCFGSESPTGNCFEIFGGEFAGTVSHGLQSVFERPGERAGFLIKTVGDNQRWFRINFSSPGTDVSFVVVSIADITDIKAGEMQLMKLERAMDASPDGISIMDNSFNYIWVNEVYARRHQTSRERMIGQSLTEVHGPRFFEGQMKPLLDRCLHGEYLSFTEWYHFPDVGRRHMAVTLQPFYASTGKIEGVITVSSDQTETRQLEEKLLHSQKLEAIGVLAGGVAHEFNNLLSGVMGNAELGLLHANDMESRLHYRNILACAKRGADISNKLLTFARSESREQTLFSVTSAIEEILELAGVTIPSNIGFSVDNQIDGDGEFWVMGDRSTFVQAVFNIIVNAIQAIGDESGRINIFINLRPNPQRPGAGSLLIEIDDSGPGIPPEVLPHIFEPFYTTKEVGKGTGLGLSILDGVVRAMAGKITCENREEGGARFRLLLPVSSSKEQVGAGGIAGRKAPAADQNLLMIDDEQLVLNSYKALFEELGYAVVAFTSPTLALDYLACHGERVGGVITDIEMPAMNGVDLLARIRTLKPEMPVVALSGYSTRVNADNFHRLGFSAYLAKPATIADLTVLAGQHLF